MATRRSASLDQPLPAAQTRSQHTVERLLAAAEDALRDEGPEGATLRAIADRAGVSLGIVYRRFADKDAVLRAVYTRFFEKASVANRALLNSRDWSRVPPATIAAQLIAGMASGYEANRKFLRALLLYARAHEDRDFRARAEGLRRETFAQVAALFEAHYGSMAHPEPGHAIVFGLTAVASILQDCLLLPERSPKNAKTEVTREVTRMFLCYVGLPSPG